MAGSFADLAALNLSANLSAIRKKKEGRWRYQMCGEGTQKFDTALTGFLMGIGRFPLRLFKAN